MAGHGWTTSFIQKPRDPRCLRTWCHCAGNLCDPSLVASEPVSLSTDHRLGGWPQMP